VHAHVEHPSLCIQARSENERLRYMYSTTTYVYILFSLLILDDRRAMVVAPFLFREERERMYIRLARCTYAYPPDIVGEIENNNNGDDEKKKSDKKARYFLIRNSRAHDMQILRRRPFLYELLFVTCFCVHPCNAIALQSRC